MKYTVKRHVVSTLLISLWSLFLLASGQMDFDCRRPGAECKANASCDISTGSCMCNTATTNYTATDYKCGDNAADSSCTKSCENGAVCVTGSSCNCGASYYGDLCQMNRVQVDCDGSTMFLNVNPDVGNFSGNIYVYGQENNDDCKLAQGTGSHSSFGEFIQNKDDLQGYRILLAHTGSPCGNIVAENNTQNGTSYKSYKRQFVVRYYTIMHTALDQIINAECRITEGSTTIFSDASLVNQNTTDDLNKVDVDSDVATVTMSVRKGDGSAITSAVQLGADIQLVFSLAPGTGFNDFQISSCTANNTDPNESTVKTLEFISDRCPSASAYSLFTSELTKTAAASANDPVVIRVNMKAFMFMGTYKQVAFVCDVVLCESENMTKCSTKQCPGLFASNKAEDPSPTNSSSSSSNNQSGNSTSTDPSNQTTNSTSNTSPNNATSSNTTSDSSNNSTSNNITTPESSTNSSSNATVDPSSNPTNNSTSGDSSVGSRRKRDAGEPDHQKVTTTITVIDPAATDSAIKDLERRIEEKDCFNQPEILACVVVLATAVLFLLTVSVLLIMGQMNYKQRVKNYSGRPNETLRIPRLELQTTTLPYNNMNSINQPGC